jgi:hypothetical protein
VCKVCNAKEDVDIVGVREQREKAEIAHLEATAMVVGAGFHVKVEGRGPRWWCCERCGKECVSDDHLAWAGR